MLKAMLEIILIVGVSVGYYYRRKKIVEKRQNEMLVKISDECVKINGNLNRRVGRRLSMWEEINEGEYLTKEDMAKINKVPFEKFKRFTSEYEENIYRDGGDIIRLQNAYYRNSGELKKIKKELKKIKKSLEEVPNKNCKKYRVILLKVRGIEGLLEEMQRPKRNFLEYRNNIYAKQKIANL
ncbi:MAG: hypothetical protein ACRDAU_01445 [Clostridium sp.]